MGLNSGAVIAAVSSAAGTLGLFEKVNGHEPKSAPATGGLTAAVWLRRVTPTAKASGLAVTAARLVLMVRVYGSMLSDPQDDIDPRLCAATDALLDTFCGDFTLGGLIRNVDILGEHGVPLDANAGYLNQDGRLFRVVDITLPLIINDAWTQVA
jgi:hypothetical protein